MELKREMNIDEVKTLPNYVFQGEPVYNFLLSGDSYQSELFFDKKTQYSLIDSQ